MKQWAASAGGVALWAGLTAFAFAQAPAAGQGIYTCVDKHGRRITADRPIPECLDREQRELSPSGITRRQIGPSLSDTERAALEAQQRKEAEERVRAIEEKRRERALVARYPDKATHDIERNAALLIVDDVMSAGTAARESIALIKAAGATPHAVAIALDRQEKATENGVDVEHSAVQYVRNQLGMQVCAIAKLADLLLYLSKNGGAEMRVHHERVFAYRQKYGVTEG